MRALWPHTVVSLCRYTDVRQDAAICAMSFCRSAAERAPKACSPHSQLGIVFSELSNFREATCKRKHGWISLAIWPSLVPCCQQLPGLHLPSLQPQPPPEHAHQTAPQPPAASNHPLSISPTPPHFLPNLLSLRLTTSNAHRQVQSDCTWNFTYWNTYVAPTLPQVLF